MEKLTELSRKIIEFDTVSFKPNLECAQFLANCLEDIGAEVSLFHDKKDGKAQVLGRMGPSERDFKRKGLILSGHFDIVPFEKQPGWSVDPLALTFKDELIYGRGTSDMKVFIVQSMIAAEKYKSSDLKYPLYFLFTCDEEICCQGISRLLPELEKIKMQLPSVALIGEPTDGKVYHAHKGVGVFKLRVHGKAGHSSRPDLGISAIEDMARVIQLIEEENIILSKEMNKRCQELYPDFPFNSFNIGAIKGGLADNMIPEFSEISVSCRSHPELEADTMISRLEEKVIKLNTKSKIEFVDVMVAPAMESSCETPLYETLMECCHQEKPTGAFFATDAGHVSKLDIDCYICGPGSLSQAHQPNESITQSSFYSGVNMVQKSIERTCF